MNDDLVGGGNALILLLIGAAIAGATLFALIAWQKGKPAIARSFLGAAALIGVAYAGGVIAASAASTETTLAPGETKWFCGFYLDCHLGLSLERVETVAELPAPGGPVKAEGAFHVLTVDLHNSAKNPNVDMLLYRPKAYIIDAGGRRYSRSSSAEAVVAKSGRPAPLGPETTVHHEPLRATLVFDLPPGVQSPLLMVEQGWLVERAIELGLINDENSIFHKRTYIALSPADSRIATTGNH